MTFEQAIATQPQWIGYWLNWLLFGALILPVSLLIWRKSIAAGLATVLATVAAGFGTN